jgi:hypothetical protein
MIHAASAGASGVESDVRDTHAQSPLPLAVKRRVETGKLTLWPGENAVSGLRSRAHWPVQFNEPHVEPFRRGSAWGFSLLEQAVLDLAFSPPYR